MAPVQGILLKMVSTNDCAISLFTTDILLRYKSEWDPRAHAHTKGGYLEGEIRVPRVRPFSLQTYLVIFVSCRFPRTNR